MFTEEEAINAAARFGELVAKSSAKIEYFNGLDFSLLSGDFSDFTDALKLAQKLAQDYAKMLHQKALEEKKETNPNA